MRKNYTLKTRLHSYIGHPYWPEMERLITITKESGMSRARSTANRRKALEQYLQAAGMTFAQYEELEKKAAEPFYKAGDRIIVPELHVTSMVVATCDTIRAAGRPCPPDQVRSAMRFSDWMTDRSKPDGVWERFAVVTAGTGQKLSNQRALRSNPYVGSPPGGLGDAKGVQCSGIITLDESMVKPSVLLDALRWAGTDVGIGASRKMGWGRFDVLSLD